MTTAATIPIPTSFDERLRALGPSEILVPASFSEFTACLTEPSGFLRALLPQHLRLGLSPLNFLFPFDWFYELGVIALQPLCQ